MHACMEGPAELVQPTAADGVGRRASPPCALSAGLSMCPDVLEPEALDGTTLPHQLQGGHVRLLVTHHHLSVHASVREATFAAMMTACLGWAFSSFFPASVGTPVPQRDHPWPGLAPFHPA